MTRKNVVCLVLAPLLLLALSASARAQKNEIAFSVGVVLSSDQSTVLTLGLACPPNCNETPNFQSDPQIAYEGVLARTLHSFHVISIEVELPVVGVPARAVDAGPGTFAGLVQVSSIFFTPSVRFRILPSSAISPFASVGGGLAHFGRSGSAKNTGALQFGAGLDFKTPLPKLSFRAEARDFFTGTSVVEGGPLVPATSRQHNIFAGGGLVLHF